MAAEPAVVVAVAVVVSELPRIIRLQLELTRSRSAQVEQEPHKRSIRPVLAAAILFSTRSPQLEVAAVGAIQFPLQTPDCREALAVVARARETHYHLVLVVPHHHQDRAMPEALVTTTARTTVAPEAAAVPVPRDKRVKSRQAAMAATGLRLRSLDRLSPTLVAAAAPKWLTLLLALAEQAVEVMRTSMRLERLERRISAAVAVAGVTVVVTAAVVPAVAASSFFVIRPAPSMRPAVRLRPPARIRFIRLQPRVHLPLR